MDLPSPIPTEELLGESGRVRRLAQALVRRADLAHDVAQDVMLAALRQPQAPNQLRAWLAAVTRRLAARTVRSQRLRARAEAEAAPPPHGDAEQRTAERLQLHRRLTDCVLALPEPYRTTVTLRFFDDLPPRAIARRLGTSSEVVRKRLQRGLEMLRERLDADFGGRTSWARAFAGFGLLESSGPWLLLSLLAMNKLSLAAAAALAVGVWCIWPDTALPPVGADTVAAAAAEPARAAGRESAAAGADAGSRRSLVPVPAPSPTPECTIEVVDDGERAVADAVVYGWAAGSQKWTTQATDAHGRCSFGAVDGPGAVMVVADGHFPLHAAFAERRGEHRIVLPAGEVVEGTLTVDDAPGAGWRLSLAGVPLDPAMPGALQTMAYAKRWCQAVCGRDGAFRFVGVPPGWKGKLSLPQPLWFTDPEAKGSAFEVTAPQRAIDLRTTQLPTVRGRVVWADDGSPVAWPSSLAYARFDDGDNSPAIGLVGNRDGTFAIGFYDGSPSRRLRWLDPSQRPRLSLVQLSFEDQEGTTEAKVELQRDLLAAKEEIVVRLERAPITYFRCIDTQGQPIAGARVAARGTSEPTDEGGRGWFAGGPGEVELVGSSAHRIGPIDTRPTGKGTLADPLVFVLQPTNTVIVQLEGELGPAQRTILRSKVLPFAGQRPAAELDERLVSLARSGSSWRHTRLADGTAVPTDFSLSFERVESDSIVLHSLEPGASCEIAVLDALGRDQATVAFTAPAFGEQLRVALPVPAESAAVEGRVVDAQGNGLAGVEVELELVVDGNRVKTAAGNIAGAYRRTEGDGRFGFANAGDLRDAVLSLSAEGFIARRIEPVVSGIDHALERGLTYEVRLVDADGLAVDLPVLRRNETARGRSDQLAPGVWRFSDVAAGTETLVCKIGADEFTLEHDTRQPTATLRVPRPGFLRLESPNGWPAPSGTRGWLVAVASCLDAPHRPVRLSPDWPMPEFLLPGTWRLELFECSQPDRSLPVTERSLGLAAEVVLRAGEQTTAILQ